MLNGRGLTTVRHEPMPACARLMPLLDRLARLGRLARQLRIVPEEKKDSTAVLRGGGPAVESEEAQPLGPGMPAL